MVLDFLLFIGCLLIVLLHYSLSKQVLCVKRITESRTNQIILVFSDTTSRSI